MYDDPYDGMTVAGVCDALDVNSTWCILGGFRTYGKRHKGNRARIPSGNSSETREKKIKGAYL